MRMYQILPLAFMLSSGAALADEVWNTPAGEVIYEADEGSTAILSYAIGDDKRGYLYFPGLAGNVEDRGIHHGYWIVPDAGECGAVMKGPNEEESDNWGRATIMFHDKGFPSDWTLLTGICFGEPDTPLVGTAVTGQ